jgi:predicted PurR-regulated permease PerM
MGKDPTSRTILVLAGVALLAWGIWLVHDVLPPFVIAFALALLLDPLHDRIERMGVGRGFAVALTFALFMAVFIAVITYGVPRVAFQVADLLRNAETYSRRLEELADGWVRGNQTLLQKLNLPPTLTEFWQQYRGQIAGFAQGMLLGAFGALQSSAGVLSWIIVIPLVTLYLLIDLDKIRDRILYLPPPEHRETVFALGSKVGGVFAAYFRGLTGICAAYSLLVYLVLALGFQLPYALTLGLLAFLCYAVPYLGQLSLIAVCVGIAWVSGRPPAQVVGVGVSLLVIGQIFDQIITPRVNGRQVGLHPVLGLFALMVGGQLFGLPGMVLAVPVAAAVRVVMIELYPRLGEPLPPPDPTIPLLVESASSSKAASTASAAE